MQNLSSEKAKAALLNDISAELLRRNVSIILDNLNKNTYKDLSPARLIAVTKTVTPDVINLLKPLNILDIGENRAQVALPKLTKIAPEFRLHWIGRLQTNKVKDIIGHVGMLQTLDRPELANEVERRADEREMILPTLVQVNISGEPQKGGLLPKEVLPFLKSMRGYKNIHIIGLMSIMPLAASQEELTMMFTGMRTLFDHMKNEALEHISMQELSMGMSNDYILAARCGATMVRIGTALYRE